MGWLTKRVADLGAWYTAFDLASKFSLWIGLPVSAWAGAWAAKATTSLAQYAPVSWVLSGFATATLFGITFWAIFGARRFAAIARALDNLNRPTDAVNPLDEVFERRRIRLHDLHLPGAGPVRNKTFVECDLVGPAVIAFSGGPAGMLANVGFIGCDLIKVGQQGIRIQNCIELHNVNMRGGRIIGATIYITQAMADTMPPGGNIVAG